jgi:signal peptidase II
MTKARTFWPILLALLLADCATKRVVESTLSPSAPPQPFIGDVVRLRLAYNTGAATGISFGAHSREIIAILALVMLALLARLYRATPDRDWKLGGASALLIAGALGNLWDRVRSTQGVVDFIDVGVGATRFWTFNVADMGVTVGAALMALLLARGESGESAPAGRASA